MSSDYWNPILKDGRAKAVFEKPHDRIPDFVRKLKARKAKTVLDIGFGLGRHTLYLARNGFNVYGFDSSRIALNRTKRKLKDGHLVAHLSLSDLGRKLPYESGFFDAEIAVAVIHHTSYARLKLTTSEMRRVLKKGGMLFLTAPAGPRRSQRSRKVGYRTYVPLEGLEKGISHFYFNKAELRILFKGFDLKIETIVTCDVRAQGRKSRRFIVTGIKR